MKTKTINLEIPTGKTPVWKEVNGQTVLVLEDEKDNRPVMERIKTFADAKAELGDDHPLVDAYNCMSGIGDPDITVYLKLRVITAALNEGWVRRPDNKQVYYPGFYLFSEKEADNNGFKKLWRWGDSSFNDSSCGLACTDSDDVWLSSDASRSPLLAYKTTELAAYSFKQFNDLWAAYLLIKPIKYKE